MNDGLEKELITASRDGDKSAYAKLVKIYSGRVFSICLGMLGNNHDAEDIAQQVFLKGLTDINQLRRREQFGAWLSRIAKNLCIDFLRRQKRRRNILADQAGTSQSDSKLYPELQAALARLPQDSLVALMLYYFDGRSTKSIAETFEISVAAAQARMSRARKQLRKLLEAEGDK